MFAEGDDECEGQGQSKQKTTLSHSSLQTAMLLLGRHLAGVDRRARKVCPTVPHSPLLFSHLIGRAEVQKRTLANEEEAGRRSTAWMNVARVFGIPDANQGAMGCLHHPRLTDPLQLNRTFFVPNSNIGLRSSLTWHVSSSMSRLSLLCVRDFLNLGQN